MENEIKVNYEEVKTAVHDLNVWPGHACIMIDVSTGRIWTDIFRSDNDEIIYNSDSICTLYCKVGLPRSITHISAKRVAQTYQEILDAIHDPDKTEEDWEIIYRLR